MSNITLNIVEPASPTPTPVDPGTGTVVPDTGLFTRGIGGAEAAIIATVGLVVILAIIGAIIYYNKHKQGKVSNIFAKYKHAIKSKKHAPGLAVLALLVSIGTVAGLLKLGANAEEADSTEDTNITSSLTVDVSNSELTIELGDEPVFAVLPVDITVAEATEAGYTLTAYAEDTNLLSTTDSSNIIPMVTVEEDELVALTDNTYGLSLSEPEGKDEEVYTALSADSSTPTFITDKDYEATEANDTTTIYYGFYITPDVPYGTYTGSNINYEANPNYITNLAFNGNGSDGGVAMEGMTLVAGDTITLPENTFTKEDYTFTEWNTQADGEGKAYADEAEFTAAEGVTEDITLYAQWEVLPTDLTFTAGDHIDTLMVADISNNYKPFYVTPTSADRSIVFTAPVEGTKYIITVVPEAGYVLSSDFASSSYEVAFSTGTLASSTLLTTTYTAGSTGNNITISAAQAGSDSAHPAYTTMQSLTAAQCPAYTDSAQGINVTDSRDNKSYTVAKFGNYCYMLSNLRLDGGTELATDTSHVSSAYTLPADTGSGGWATDYCGPYMASTNGEYYYNWPAATARTNSTSGTSSCSNDTSNSVGDICPAGWSLPTYEDITPATLWNSGANPGMLSTTGYFYSGSQGNVGLSGSWWSSTRESKYNSYSLSFGGTGVYRNDDNKVYGQSVRCMRSS